MSARRVPGRVPVVMYHSVGPEISREMWRDLTCSPALFERQLTLLKERDYRAISLSEVRRRQEEGRAPEDRCLALTFDDGYLDNWTFVYPLLRKAGWRATVYVSPDFVDPAADPRPTLEEVWSGRCSRAELRGDGYMSWAEMRRAAAEGVLEIGCHSRTHTWYPTGPEVVDYHRPGTPYPWLAWNAAPERKHAWLREDQRDLVPLGTPVHVHGRSLGIRRYFPPPELAEACARFAAERGGAEFFSRPAWRTEIDAFRAALHVGAGRYETDDELARRVNDEIVGARDAIELALGTRPRHFAWPGGAYTGASWSAAERAGFETIVVGSSDLERRRSSDPRLVRRTPCFNFVSIRRWRFPNDDPRILWHACEAERGSSSHRLWLRVRKAQVALRSLAASGRQGPTDPVAP